MAENNERRSFEVDGMTVHLNIAPPVYAPGGPVAFLHGLPGNVTRQMLSVLEKEATAQGAVLLVIQCVVEEPEKETLLLKSGYTFASSWYSGPPFTEGIGSVPGGLVIRTATAVDVPRMLEIGEHKREQYEGFSPIFWKKSPTPRQEFAGYVTGQVESEHNVALVAESEGEMRGYLIAQCRNLAEGYVDDYAVTDPLLDWSGAGSALLAEAGKRAEARGVQTFMIVTGHADIPKCAAARERGFVLRKNWLVKPLT